MLSPPVELSKRQVSKSNHDIRFPCGQETTTKQEKEYASRDQKNRFALRNFSLLNLNLKSGWATVHFVVDTDIYWPQLVVKHLIYFCPKRRKAVILIVEGGVRSAGVASDCSCVRIRREPAGNEDLRMRTGPRKGITEWILGCRWSWPQTPALLVLRFLP